MDLTELQKERTEITAEIQAWQRNLQQAQDAALNAQLQIAAWNGNLQRVNLWIKRLEELRHIDTQQWTMPAEIERVKIEE